MFNILATAIGTFFQTRITDGCYAIGWKVVGEKMHIYPVESEIARDDVLINLKGKDTITMMKYCEHTTLTK